MMMEALEQLSLGFLDIATEKQFFKSKVVEGFRVQDRRRLAKRNSKPKEAPVEEAGRCKKSG